MATVKSINPGATPANTPEQGITIAPRGAKRSVEGAGVAMMDVLTLIHAAADLNESGGCLSDIEPLTGPQSRITALLIMAQDKTAQAIRALDGQAMDAAPGKEVAHG